MKKEWWRWEHEAFAPRSSSRREVVARRRQAVLLVALGLVVVAGVNWLAAFRDGDGFAPLVERIREDGYHQRAYYGGLDEVETEVYVAACEVRWRENQRRLGRGESALELPSTVAFRTDRQPPIGNPDTTKP